MADKTDTEMWTIHLKMQSHLEKDDFWFSGLYREIICYGK